MTYAVTGKGKDGKEAKMLNVEVLMEHLDDGNPFKEAVRQVGDTLVLAEALLASSPHDKPAREHTIRVAELIGATLMDGEEG